MRAGGDEFATELSEYVSTGGRHGGCWNYRTPSGRNRTAAEAEDALCVGDSPRGYASRGRSGLYYSPPGTSYTILERPSSGMQHHPPSARDYAPPHRSRGKQTQNEPGRVRT